MVVAAVMALGMSAPAWAATTTMNSEEAGYVDLGQTDADNNTVYFKDEESIELKKAYIAINSGTTSPKENFYFTIERTSVTDQKSGLELEDIPLPELPNNVKTEDGKNKGYITVTQGAAEVVEADGEPTTYYPITITLPKYDSVGKYTYTIKEVQGTTAGVTYWSAADASKDIKLVVTVNQDADGKIRVAAVHTESPADENNASGTKTDKIQNEYSAGKLAISKTVTGNLGDRSKEFSVTVKFKTETDKYVNEDITYGDDKIEKGWTDSKEVSIKLKHGETITFNNIPYGVTYDVTEDDYTAEADGKYDAAKYVVKEGSASDTLITDAEVNVAESTDPVTGQELDAPVEFVEITNNKGTTIDTGVVLDSLPYILILAAVAIGIGAFVIRKRDEDQF
jgi:pilin isopeptide linkage protein